MALESPLYQSSLELIGHSITHFNGTEELDRKLLILHIANAVEAILKDMLLDIGESIYKNPKETVTITHCIESLKQKGIPIPYLNKIELLIDERNALQHRFGSPNELTSIFYMNIAMDFFKDILLNHYKQDIDEILPQFTKEKDLIAFKMRKPLNDSELDSLKSLSKVHPLGALLAAMSYLESRIDKFAREVGLEDDLRMRPSWAMMSHRFLSRYGVELPEDMEIELSDVRKIRNQAAHGRKDPTKQEVEKCIRIVERYEKILEGTDKDVIRTKVAAIQRDRELEREREKQSALPIEA